MPISKSALPSASATSALLSVASFLPLMTSLRIASVSIHALVLGFPAALPLASGALAFGAPTLPPSFAAGLATLPVAVASGLTGVLGAALLASLTGAAFASGVATALLGAFTADRWLLELGLAATALLWVAGLLEVTGLALLGVALTAAGLLELGALLLLAARLLGVATAFAGATGRALVLVVLFGLGLILN